MHESQTGGVYALRHGPSGKLYVGSTYNFAERRRAWWQNINQRRHIPHAMSPFVGRRDEWDFIVLWSGKASPQELVEFEQAAIDRLRDQVPGRLLNAQTACRYDTLTLIVRGRRMSERAWAKETGTPRATIRFRLGIGWTPEQAVGLEDPPIRNRAMEQHQAAASLPKTVVLDGDQTLSSAEAARRLGCSSETLRERLRRRRARYGESRVQLAELMALSERHRRK